MPPTTSSCSTESEGRKIDAGVEEVDDDTDADDDDDKEAAERATGMRCCRGVADEVAAEAEADLTWQMCFEQSLCTFFLCFN